MKKKVFKIKGAMNPETIIWIYGYEYHLVSVDRGQNGVEPRIFDMRGFALKSCNKIKS